MIGQLYQRLRMKKLQQLKDWAVGWLFLLMLLFFFLIVKRGKGFTEALNG